MTSGRFDEMNSGSLSKHGWAVDRVAQNLNKVSLHSQSTLFAVPFLGPSISSTAHVLTSVQNGQQILSYLINATVAVNPEKQTPRLVPVGKRRRLLMVSA